MISEGIKDATSAVQSLPALWEAITASPIYGWVILILFFGWLVLNHDVGRVLDLLGRKRRQELEALEAYCAAPNTDDARMVRAMQDLRDTHYLRIATGMHLERKQRSAYLKLHEEFSHVLHWRMIRRAAPHLRVLEDESIEFVPLGVIERVGYHYNQVVGYLLLLCAASFATLGVISASSSWLAYAAWLGGAIIAACLATIVFIQNWPISAAKRIAALLEVRRRQSDAVG